MNNEQDAQKQNGLLIELNKLKTVIDNLMNNILESKDE